jgi:hypothetical protein
MSRESRRRREGKKRGKRYARLALVTTFPDPEPKVGVEVGWGKPGDANITVTAEGHENAGVVPPDEARTLADLYAGDDPGVARQLRKAAGDVDRVLAHPDTKHLKAVPSVITGPRALLEWVGRHRDLFRLAYRTCPPGSVLWAMPQTESLDDPPVTTAALGDTGLGLISSTLQVLSREEATEELARVGMSDSTRGAAPPGYFYVVASRTEGRFQGTFVGCLSLPGPENN